jgi:hypothetical protein
VIELHNDGSNEGSDNRERHHHQQQPILVQGFFYLELTEPKSCLPTHRSQGYPASRRCQPPTHSTSPFGQWNIQDEAPRGKQHKSTALARSHVVSGVSPENLGRVAKAPPDRRIQEGCVAQHHRRHRYHMAARTREFRPAMRHKPCTRPMRTV